MSYLVKTVYFPALKSCIVSSVTVKAGPQEEVFRSTPAHGPLGLMSKVFDVFSNRNLPSTSWGATKGNSNQMLCLGVFWTALTSNLQESFSCPAEGFCLALGESIASPDGKIAFKLCMCIYVLTYV